MQLSVEKVTHSRFTVQSLNQLDSPTTRRLHSLGIQSGSRIEVVSVYPFHGPVVIKMDQQRIALRYPIFKSLIGGDS
ncbi:MAG: FeoA family protein [Lentilactobacillus diolivorans]|jgi:ferrous iron transport protein A|uniref:Ferrous iron transporter FeoA-like domain-containing protein n=2 Tax=Lentilactobacillus diolivorans TaxID=179838 RepID=A0A0R1SRF9_9LACO|nr:FeoA family protein [Lentilactobacillus diolivorans]RRG04414.1 MAG: ferrous iron transport protein A [Lactobacillus sp.]KRL69074.1 hypothetical protein FC85_GL002294 [Lentilactobacillus diolivorans DSM 14421]MCH4164234.1 ferrous iron transport protein A [Lentilactobacillus diolivorans]MDH5104616.1 ferrous iron transport protein A [Lentilactobacillus diolivorans]GEP22480.1 iron transporter FeoA [Lentilactobacillus diolivorans]